MRTLAMLSVLLYMCISVNAQIDSTDEKEMDEAVVYSNKFVEKKKNLAQKIDIISARSIAKFNSQNTGDLLIRSGNIFVQKSQQGGSSPVLRGFEASRVLLVVDGIRLNNAIYRSGHLQNAITIDQNMLERVEVMYGPSSTLYGSDALGGMVHMRTKSPILSVDEKTKIKGTAFTRYSSVNNEITAHADLNVGGKKFAWLQSYTISDFGDMKMGDNYNNKYPDFGRRSLYIKTINGIDSIVNNNDDRIQRNSGYTQWDILQKILFKQNEKITHQINFQYSSSTDIPRYDRLQDTKNFGGSIGTTLRFAEWYYGPQTRFLAAYDLNISNAGFFDGIKLNLNYQDVKESRQQREYRRYDRFDSRREQVKVAGFILDGRKAWDNNEINIGLDGQLNDVTSKADRTNLQTGVISKLDTRYPDGKNNMNYFGLYAQHVLKMKEGKLVLNDGIRFQLINLRSNIVDNSFFNFPFTEIKQTPFAVTGNLGLVYMPEKTWRFTINLSSGFRAPNIDDATKIFESASASKRLIVPNPDLGPEYTYNFDLGFSKTIPDKLRLEVTGFYTLFNNAIATAPFTLNGQDSVDYNGVKSAVFASQNVSKAFLNGFNARLDIKLNNHISWDNTISYTYGRYKNADGTKKPLDHVPPVFGKSGITYSKNKLNTELFCQFNGWKRIKDYNPDGEDNGQYATPDGIPSWYTLNWNVNYSVSKLMTLQVGVENIFDKNYRYFASGFSAPGRNIVAVVRVNF